MQADINPSMCGRRQEMMYESRIPPVCPPWTLAAVKWRTADGVLQLLVFMKKKRMPSFLVTCGPANLNLSSTLLGHTTRKPSGTCLRASSPRAQTPSSTVGMERLNAPNVSYSSRASSPLCTASTICRVYVSGHRLPVPNLCGNGINYE